MRKQKFFKIKTQHSIIIHPAVGKVNLSTMTAHKAFELWKAGFWGIEITDEGRKKFNVPKPGKAQTPASELAAKAKQQQQDHQNPIDPVTEELKAVDETLNTGRFTANMSNAKNQAIPAIEAATSVHEVEQLISGESRVTVLKAAEKRKKEMNEHQ